MGAMTLALTMGGLSALSSIASTSQQNRQAQYNKKMAEAQAQAARNQAKVTAEKGRIEAENLDRERNALTRQYADLQAGNVASFGALAMDVLSGNASRYAGDVGLNRYQKAVNQWETDENVKASLTNAANYDAAASWYGNSVKGLGSTLLTAGLSGLTSGIGAYATAGGFGGESGFFGDLFNEPVKDALEFSKKARGTVWK